MTFIRFPGRDERVAAQFEDLASQLQAGLSLRQISASSARGDDALADLARQRGVDVDAVEQQALEAGWRAGRAEAALRQLAARRTRRAALARQMLDGLAYPVALLALATLVAVILGVSLGAVAPLWTVAALLVTTAVAGFTLRRGITEGSSWCLRLPVLGGFVRDVAEIPYLSTLHSLYASGVPILSAHPAAVANCPVRSIRVALQSADRTLSGGVSLAVALAGTAAIQAETLQLVTTGERAGSLEDALQRAIHRRTDTLARSSRTLARAARFWAFLVAVAVVAFTVWSFYGGYADALRRLRH